MIKKITCFILAALMSASMLLAGCEKDVKDNDVNEGDSNVTNSDVSEFYLNNDLSSYIKLGQYKNLEVDMNPEINDDELDSEINSILYENEIVKQITDRVVANGDIVNINFSGYLDGVLFEGGSAEAYELEIGSNSFIDGFEEGLVGAAVGEELDLNLTFSSTYHNAELAGKAVVFKVKVNYIVEYDLPELNDEFVKNISEFSNVNDYMENLRSEMRTQNSAYLNENKGSYVWSFIMKNMEVTSYPQDEIDKYYNEMMDYYETFAEDNDMSLEDLMQMYYNTDVESLKEEASVYAEDSVRNNLVIYSIAKAENISLTDEEYSKGLATYAEYYEYESIEEFEEFYGKALIKHVLLQEKIQNILAETIIVK